MGYHLMGLIHARLYGALHDERGQGTVEYVALLFLVGAIFTAVLATSHGMKDMGIATKISGTLKKTLDDVAPGTGK